MIKTFADRDTEAVFTRRVARRLPGEIQRTARRKLIQLDRAQDVRDLRYRPAIGSKR